MRRDNVNLGKTRITDLIRVSSAAIHYELSDRYQYETFIFSDDPRQRTTQVIHGSSYVYILDKMVERTKKIHEYIALNLTLKYNL